MARLASLRARLDEGVRASGGIVIGEDSPRLPTIGSVALPGASSASLVVQFDLAGIAVSAGAACSSGKMKGSGVLVAMNAPREVTDSAIRVSFGPHHQRKRRRRLPRRMEPHRGASQGRMIYLDYQATTPVAPEVVTAMRPWIDEKFANPHSPSRAGREAAAAIEVARDRITAAIGLAGGRFAFTGGATEALNWALKGSFERLAASGRRKLVTIATEHAAVLDTAEWLEGQGAEVVRLPVGADGLIDLATAEAAIGQSTAMVAAMLVNNEIGVIQPIARTGPARPRARRADAVRRGAGLRANPDPRRLRHGRALGPQDPRPQGRRRPMVQGRLRTCALAPRRRAGSRPALGNTVPGAVRRLRRGRAPRHHRHDATSTASPHLHSTRSATAGC